MKSIDITEEYKNMFYSNEFKLMGYPNINVEDVIEDIKDFKVKIDAAIEILEKLDSNNQIEETMTDIKYIAYDLDILNKMLLDPEIYQYYLLDARIGLKHFLDAVRL